VKGRYSDRSGRFGAGVKILIGNILWRGEYRIGGGWWKSTSSGVVGEVYRISGGWWKSTLSGVVGEVYHIGGGCVTLVVVITTKKTIPR